MQNAVEVTPRQESSLPIGYRPSGAELNEMLRKERRMKTNTMHAFWKERRDNLKRTDQLLYGSGGRGGSGPRGGGEARVRQKHASDNQSGSVGDGLNSTPMLLEEYTTATRLSNVMTTMENDNQR